MRGLGAIFNWLPFCACAKMPTSPPNTAVMAASTGSEVTTALNRFITVLVDAHLGPNMEDLTRRLRTTELSAENSTDKERQLEQSLALQVERLQNFEKALSAKASEQQLAQLQKSVESVLSEQGRMRIQQEQVLEEIHGAIQDIKSQASESEQSIRCGAEKLQRLEGAISRGDRKMEAVEQELRDRAGQAEQFKAAMQSLGESLKVREAAEKAAITEAQAQKSVLAVLEERSATSWPEPCRIGSRRDRRSS
ncbi:unnamed protein product [Effrenium voratum]|nr:unnamed protein product [Effrenium voratum]